VESVGRHIQISFGELVNTRWYKPRTVIEKRKSRSAVGARPKCYGCYFPFLVRSELRPKMGSFVPKRLECSGPQISESITGGTLRCWIKQMDAMVTEAEEVVMVETNRIGHS